MADGTGGCCEDADDDNDDIWEPTEGTGCPL